MIITDETIKNWTKRRLNEDISTFHDRVFIHAHPDIETVIKNPNPELPTVNSFSILSEEKIWHQGNDRLCVLVEIKEFPEKGNKWILRFVSPGFRVNRGPYPNTASRAKMYQIAHTVFTRWCNEQSMRFEYFLETGKELP